MAKDEKKKRGSIKKWLCYITGSAVVYAIAMACLPEVMNTVSGKINKTVVTINNRIRDDETGPEIVKKEEVSED